MKNMEELKGYLKKNRAYKHFYKEGKKSIWITMLDDPQVIPSISIEHMNQLGMNKNAIESFVEFRKFFNNAKIKSFKRL